MNYDSRYVTNLLKEIAGEVGLAIARGEPRVPIRTGSALATTAARREAPAVRVGMKLFRLRGAIVSTSPSLTMNNQIWPINFEDPLIPKVHKPRSGSEWSMPRNPG